MPKCMYSGVYFCRRKSGRDMHYCQSHGLPNHMNPWNFLTQPNLIQHPNYATFENWRKMNIDILPSRSCPVFLLFCFLLYEKQGWDLEYWVWPTLDSVLREQYEVDFHEMRVFHVWKDILLPMYQGKCLAKRHGTSHDVSCALRERELG